MTKYVINGGKTLNGEVTISGAKNAAVAIVPAALLADGPVRIENVPKIIDVTLQLEIMRELGAQIRLVNATTVEIENAHKPSLKPHELERKLRASYYLLGVLLGKYGFAEVAMPGGCNFGGVRPIDQHIKGFEALGAKVTLPKGGFIRAEAPEDGLKGAHIYFDVVTVGATMNVMLAAVLAKGQTILENCAKEPHIVDLANFLNAMGADVKGAGTDVIKIRGVEKLHGGSYSIIPDQIEAGTFMAAVAACGGSVLVKNVIPKHLECITAKLKEMSVEITEFDDSVLVRRVGALTKTNLKTLPYPGFPTDMQPQMTTALCLAEGTSIVTEGVWDSRYRYTEELTRMGANIHVDGKIAIVEGVSELKGAPVRAHDLRAGAAMVIAGLAAKGVTEVEQVQNIERGYETLVEKFVALGADMYRSEIPDNNVVPAAN
ncbi:UDP-N-acetylglucosamine 1-carboxyvinyltransferase [Agathobaculum sp.]|uniref:UDP-N-acetylglucosamine 1-carboxyvinyltransferase n=1 Tax=Agathobaculum sp. TaxID=2048138 RepID=UPI002A7FD7C8|nr:UDP-N-acetylglucosamine 1-carboxyvinyltransferase [Agathobaculum sp.]MDY3618322.1 UDP-N-acetylglucosamine 1-carboxyvinyltransferase [Agathobaculum sp.]